MSLETHLVELERKHRMLDQEISQEQQHAQSNKEKVASLKRRKLQLKDTITKLRHELVQKTVH
ncbi:MAG: YdcH family protein [Beijerinckiaceae bacterium]